MSRGRCCVLLAALIAAVAGVDENKIVGSDVHFRPDIAGPLDDSSGIVWRYKDNAGNIIRVIEWDSDFKTLESRSPKFKDHVDLNKTTAELTIRTVTLEHTGLYTIEINSKEQDQKYKLTVMDGVPKPELKNEPTGNPDVIYLICEYDGTIQWDCTSKEKPEGVPLNSQRKGQSLTFKKTETHNVCCTCTLSNPVSKKTSDQVCEKDVFHEELNSGAAVGAVIAILIILIISISIFLYCYLCKNSFHDKVYDGYKYKPCIGGVLKLLERYRKTDPQDEEKRNGKNLGTENEHVREPLSGQTSQDNQDNL